MAVWKGIIGVFLGLVFQFSQVASGLSACLDRPQECAPRSCHCCPAGTDVCPCVKSSEKQAPSSPVVPSEKSAKLDPVGVCKPDEVILFGRPVPVDSLPSPPSIEFVGVFCGVPLTVSFCRFLI